MLPKPFNFPVSTAHILTPQAWLRDNRELLSPPVNNFCLYNTKDFTVMAVGGPNKRTDYHVNPTEEYFYQIQGDMLLKVVDGDAFVDVNICEGDMYLLPANIPHNPVRFANTTGIVVERQRPAGENGISPMHARTH